MPLQRHDSWGWDEDRSASEIAAEGALRRGWLHKYSGGKGSFFTLGNLLAHWDRRFVVLSDDGLRYYRREDDKAALGCVPLKSLALESAPVTWRPPSSQFIVRAHGRDLCFKASSEDEAAAWVAVLRDCVGSGSGDATGGGERVPSSEHVDRGSGSGDAPHAEGGVMGDGDEADDDDHATHGTPMVQTISLDYVEPQALYRQLVAPLGSMPNVRLVKWSFLDERARQLERASTDEERAALALPRRQQLEQSNPEAFYTAADVTSLARGNMHFAGGPLSIVALSHCAPPQPTPHAPSPSCSHVRT
jgi:hypothetical protein